MIKETDIVPVPMKLSPSGKDYLWGGNRLNHEYGKNIPLSPLAETWECSVHPDGASTVVGGVYDGKTLKEILDTHPEFLGTKVPGGKFPILVKFIDAKKDLSVQVHPDDAYAQLHEGDNGKTEMWYVLDADENASIVYGFEHKVTSEILRKSIDDGNLEKHLHRIKPQKGDILFVPAGLVHGIGAGTLVAEVQQSSNVTYRVYDYNRTDKNGNRRALHFDKAVQVMDMKPVTKDPRRMGIVRYTPFCSRELVCRCKYFEVERVTVAGEFSFPSDSSTFQVLLCTKGSGQLKNSEGLLFEIGTAQCVFVPASSGDFSVEGNLELLRIHC